METEVVYTLKVAADLLRLNIGRTNFPHCPVGMNPAVGSVLADLFEETANTIESRIKFARNYRNNLPDDDLLEKARLDIIIETGGTTVNEALILNLARTYLEGQK